MTIWQIYVVFSLCCVTFVGSYIATYPNLTETQCRADTYGGNYEGEINVTRHGLPCKSWNSSDADTNGYAWVGDHNFCRNPGLSGTQPWCYTTDSQTPWEYCDIPLCACPAVRCENNGTLIPDTCTCNCPSDFSGIFCEKEVKYSEWRNGNYGVHATMFGCPEADEYGWMTGYVNMTLKTGDKEMVWNDDKPYTFEPHILGPFTTKTLQMNFCIMQSNITRPEGDLWPKGNYCLYKVGDNCPKGFSTGSLTIRGYSFDFGGTLPYLEIHNTTDLELFYCCREDEAYTETVELPSEFPFMLLLGPSAESCQEVSNMKVTLDNFYLVADEGFEFDFDGLHPNFTIDESLTDRVGLPFCYYEPLARMQCIYEMDWGASYDGRINVTASGKPCAPWTDQGDFTTSSRWVGEYEENFCRQIYRGRYPGCHNGKELEYCSIPFCENDLDDLHLFGKGRPYNTAPANTAFPAVNAVDGLIGQGLSFVTLRPYSKPWFLLNLQEHVEVHAIVLYRQRIWFPVNHRYVGTYVSKNRWDFLTYGAYRCDNNRNPRTSYAFRYQCKRPIVGQYIGVKNFDLTEPRNKHGYYHYFEIDEIQVFGKFTYCGRQLGLIDGNIYDYQLESSSNLDNKHIATHGRLLRPTEGWCAAVIDKKPWFMVDFIVPLKIQGLEFQGVYSSDTVKLIRSFKLMIGMNRNELTFFEDPIGTIKTFLINTGPSTMSAHQIIFNREIYTRYLKIVPVDYDEPCLKLEVLGCPKQINRDLWCNNYTYDLGYEAMKYHTFWMEETHDLDRLLKYGVDSFECFELCRNISCLSFTYTKSAIPDCFMHFGSKYNDHHRKWFISGVEEYTTSYHRLCFKDFKDHNDCGGAIDLSKYKESTIYSPSFPFLYGQGLDCKWTIYSPTFVHIEFVSIYLQQKTSETDLQKMRVYDINIGTCEDTLTIADGKGYSSSFKPSDTDLRGRSIISSSGTVEITFTSCYNYYFINRKSFELKVSTKDLPGCGTLDTCFQTCTQQAAYIMTPGFPASYRPGDSCFWKIEGFYGEFVKFDFINLDVSGESDCEKSFIAIYDVDRSDKLISLGKFCKDNRPYTTFTSSWQKLHIEFRASTEIGVAGGFLGQYRIKSYTQRSFTDTNTSCPENWHSFRSNCYTLIKQNQSLTWINAEQKCRQMNSHLVSIADELEMSFIHQLITVLVGMTDDMAYIGLRKETNGYTIDDFEWTDGSPVTFTAWYHDDATGMSQPDGLTNEKCSIIKLFSIHNMNDWHDVACAYNKISNFVCESSNTTFENMDIRTFVPPTNFTDHGLYQCSSEEYILDTFICDGVPDCLSQEDEFNCSTTCDSNQFTCDDGNCISISLYCDFVPHCPDSSDENMCERKSCGFGEWQCDNKQCINLDERCDFVPNCFDKSDEKNCEPCGSGSFQCYDQTCLPKSRVCDGFIDCSGLFHEDEAESCQYEAQSTCADWWSMGQRENGQYLINLGLDGNALVECIFEELGKYVTVTTIIHHNQEELLTSGIDAFVIIPKYSANDAHIQVLKDTSNCSQEIELYCQFTDDLITLTYNNGVTLDNRSPMGKCSCPLTGNCYNHTDMCNCGAMTKDWYTSNENDMKSDIGLITDRNLLPVRQAYKDKASYIERLFQLKLGPMICTKEIQISSNTFRCQGGQTFPSDIRCLLDYDARGEIKGCRDLSHLSNCEDFECPVGYYKCKDSYCIRSNMMCDGHSDCQFGEDEQNCDTPPCENMFRCKDSNICIDLTQRCNGYFECPNFDDELLCIANCNDGCNCEGYTSKCLILDEANVNISIPTEMRKVDLSLSDLSNLTMKLQNNFLLAELNLSQSLLYDMDQIEFGDEEYNLLILDLTYNKLTKLSQYVFKNLIHLKTLLLHGNQLLKNIEPFSFSGLIQLPMLKLQDANLYSIDQYAFHGLQTLYTLNMSSNGIEKVADSAFADLSRLNVLDLRRNKITKFTGQIFAGLNDLKELYTDAFVFCCLKPPSVAEANCLPQRDEFSSCDDMMRNNVLRVCLWVIGLCALCGNFVVLSYRIVFDRSSLSKGHGIFITSLGIADFSMGIYMLIIASADVIFRGNYIWNDLSWRYGPTCKFAGILSTFSSECSVMFLFFITLDRFVAIKYPFGQIRFDKKKALGISASVYILCLIIAIVPIIPNSYFDGDFYSRSAVCLALPLTRDKPNGWEYSFGIFIVFNFALFLVIAAFQLIIYREVKTSMMHVRSTKKKQDLTIARNLFMVVFSDFLCWFPVGVMGLMALSGESIPGEVYAWTAVFILPINSALNPFLYTFSAIVRTRRESIKKKSVYGSTHSNVSKCPSIQETTKDSSSCIDDNDKNLVDEISMMIDKLLENNSLDDIDMEKLRIKLSKAQERLTIQIQTTEEAKESAKK